ncbi:MAG: hypothetical protein RMX97_17640 [Nostoc sp. DedQUE11]|nr:hypothetical protein [Nostoc sp. DedQUE11]MDZ8074156.1 hypothetical protein [Nostoc sp. DedQUE01]
MELPNKKIINRFGGQGEQGEKKLLNFESENQDQIFPPLLPQTQANTVSPKIREKYGNFCRL